MRTMNKPLAEILRPHTLSDVIGQRHLLGENGPLTRLIQNKYLPSIIFWGPPGVGKTTLAYILAKQFNYPFIELSGVEFSIKSLEQLKHTKTNSAVQTPGLFAPVEQPMTKTVVFIDEIHRLNKSQQAQFLPYVERGEWILIGATTENPSFEVISPLLSRSQVLILKSLSQEELLEILHKGLDKLAVENGKRLKISPEAEEYLVGISNGDARLLLNSLQAMAEIFSHDDEEISKDLIKQNLSSLHLVYDKKGDEHFDTISALHKSMRGSDPNAALYYLGRMLEGGEDPLYVARRCVRFAAEDIGNADPQALILAHAAFGSVEKIGMPECNVILAQLVIYLARAPKSNEAYMAYGKVKEDVLEHGNLPIPLKIRNAPTKFMKEVGYGEGYKYAHDYTSEELKAEQYLPDELKDRKYLSSAQNNLQQNHQQQSEAEQSPA